MTAVGRESALLGDTLARLTAELMASPMHDRLHDGGPLPREPWTRFAAGGWLDVGDGAELDHVDLVELATGVGAHLLCGPFATTAGFVVPLLRAVGWSDDADTVAAGSRLTTVVTPRPVGSSWEPVVTVADSAVHGRVRGVPYLPDVDEVMVVVRGPKGRVGVVRLEPGRDGMTIERMESVDATRPLGVLVLDGCPVTDADWLGSPDVDLARWVDDRMATTLLLLAGEALGGMREVLDRTVRYVGERHQFGVPIGTFQALRHRLADDEIARVVATQFATATARRRDAGDLALVDLLALRSVVTRSAVRIAESAIQLFGGAGYTWEHEMHLWYRRALFDEVYPIPPQLLRRSIAAGFRPGEG